MAHRGYKRKAYDDRALAFALAFQTKPTKEIAQDFGLSARYISLISAGRSRPDLQPLIQAIRQGLAEGLEEWTRQHVWTLLAGHIRVGLTGKGEPARKCREYLLDRFLPGPSDGS